MPRKPKRFVPTIALLWQEKDSYGDARAYLFETEDEASAFIGNSDVQTGIRAFALQEMTVYQIHKFLNYPPEE